MPKKIKIKHGFTLLESLVGIFLLAVLSLGIYTAYAFGMKTSVHNRLRAAAATIAEKRIETIRAMRYAEVGTEGGIPPGNLAPLITEENNGTDFSIQTSVRYLDDAYDGKAPEDTAAADYKQVEVKVNWPTNLEEKSVVLNTLITPPRIETNLGMGVLIINTVNGEGTPIPESKIQIFNNSVSPYVSLTEETDENGSLTLPGVPKSDQKYEVNISKNGYMPANTYPPYPKTSFMPIDTHLAISEGGVTSKVFIIDKIGHLKLRFLDTLGNVLPNLNFSLYGGKVIGTTVEPAPQSVYFYNETSLVSDAEGIWNSPDFHKGPYNFSISNNEYELIALSNSLPWIVSPDATTEETITMGKKTENILVVRIKEQGGEVPVADAVVKLTDSTGAFFQETKTNSDGIAYLPQIEDPAKTLNPAETYTLDITKDAYDPYQTTLTVSGLTRKDITLNPQ
ncbi:MAG: prepilin-type N-terminal cleavage/methylation domain-containing protein [Candidatus Moranbacteria bacterium]|nr:prepilin-type N-terminal cleavage/methylation domain-containing protein [Candidatus Moranbacteria bacterium]